MWYYYSPIRMAEIQKQWRPIVDYIVMQEKLPYLLVEMQNDTIMLEEILTFSYKAKCNLTTQLYIFYIYSEYIYVK